MRIITVGIMTSMMLGHVASAKTPHWTITPQGFGPVKVGMTLQSASKALGIKLLINKHDRANKDSEQCTYTLPIKSYPDLRFMLIGGKIARADLDIRLLKAKKYSTLMTDQGIRIGDSAEKVKAAYSKNQALKLEPHKYGDGNDFYFTYWMTTQQKSGIRYETTDGVVTHIQGGNHTIEWVEGCS